MKVKELSILLLTPLDLEGDDAMERWKKEIEKLVNWLINVLVLK